MNTLIFVFVCALGGALVITPLMRRFALAHGLVRKPTARDSHTEAKPRIGGIALYLSFFLALVASLPLQTNISEMLYDYRYLAILCGASLMFVTGLVDDIYGLKSSTKLLSQIVAGLVTWYGGVHIHAVSLTLSSGVELGWLSLPVTVFWIVLVTNAINLIDGLDGLAAGVTLFVSLMMGLLCIINGNFIVAIGFVALAGATLGFLRYNFNPASIFMGDSGSYFLGYSIAALSILGSVKGQATFAMLIPFLALGVPIFDALFSPLRRFAKGRKMFSPDHSHLHHKLMESGEGHRKAVIILYSITVALSAVAFCLIYVRDERAALILLVPAAILFFLFRKIGYLNYLAIDRIYGWLRDITESTKISGASRTFLDHQVEISKAHTLDEMWVAAARGFSFLQLDQVDLALAPLFPGENEPPLPFHWNSDNATSDCLAGYRFKIEYPLLSRGDQTVLHGRLTIYKYTNVVPIRQFTIRRIEQLQQELTRKIAELRSQESHSPDRAPHLFPHPHTLKN
ncbi:glycosyltransferase family 4 protein [Thermodesulfobacteriota bacterium]